QEEDEQIDEDEEAELAARQADQQMLHPFVPVDAVESEREDAGADQDEDDERRKIGRLLERLAHEAEIEPAARQGQEKGARRPHGTTLGRRGDALEDRPEHQEDENERRQKIGDDLPRRGGDRARWRIEQRHAAADQSEQGYEIDPFAGDPANEIEKK